MLPAVPAHAVHVPLWIDLAAVAFGAMQGGAFATLSRDERNDFDILGVVVRMLALARGRRSPAPPRPRRNAGR
jgi:hypothetical protein